MHAYRPRNALTLWVPAVAGWLWSVPALVWAQASPFMTGATALQTNILAWLTPIAIILVMVLGAMAMANRMNREEGDERLWFVVDELDALGQIDGLKDALARLRKFGGRCVLGFQSVAQVSSTYGSGEAQTIVENCGNTLILRCSGSEHGGTSQFASRLIGEREISRITTSRSRRATELFPTITRAEHRGVESAVMGSQIEQLPDLSGYLKLASSPEWRRVRLHAPARHEREVPTHRAGKILDFPRRITAPPAAVIEDRDRAAGHDGFEPD